MPRNMCCCDDGPREKIPSCCDEIFFTDFITLYGDTLAEHAEVNTKDWIVLKVFRPGVSPSTYINQSAPPQAEFSCNCGTEGLPSGNCSDPDGFFSVVNADTLPPDELARRSAIARETCCVRFNESVSVKGSAPMYFAYKYSGCNLIWYPREFSFNYDPHVAQCNGFIHTNSDYSQYPNSCWNWTRQQFGAGFADPASANGECGVYYSSDSFPAAQTVGHSPILPCACSPHPHIHGGIYDSLYNRVNVRLSPGSLGYIPYMLPFSPKMLLTEAGCCWCANGNIRPWKNFIKARAQCFAALYPKSDSSGKIINIDNACGPGFNCVNSNDISGNPKYSTNCYKRGISPYLLRVAQLDYKMAYDIWGFGQTPDTLNDFGAIYKAKTIEIKNNFKDIDITFVKQSGLKSRLKDVYIGTVHLEHHFEMYAYRSEDGSAVIEMQSLQNNCNALVSGYESYGGTITKRGNLHRWNPWKYDSILWQVRRGVPRRVMYKGSGVPLFHFDLVNMEVKSFENNIIVNNDYFDGEKFLEHYYRYFFSMIYFQAGGCEFPGDTPSAPEWDFSHLLDSYEYVTTWLQLMVKHGVLRIKDHAIDIADDLNKIIERGGYDSKTGEVVIANDIDLEVNGVIGYKQLIDLFGVSAGQATITPKLVKSKLLNPSNNNWVGPDGETKNFRAFLPRRTVLPPADSRPGLTAWGFTGSEARVPFSNYRLIGSPSRVTETITNVPIAYTDEAEEVFQEVLSPQRVISGLYGNFVIDASGKISGFGHDIEDSLYYGQGEYQCPDFLETWRFSAKCIPYYLDAGALFQDGEKPGEIVPRDPANIPDGRVIDIAYKRDFVVALVSFDQDGIAANCDETSGIGFTPAFENDSINYTMDNDGGPNSNVNGNNKFIQFGTERKICSLGEPFNTGAFGNPPVPGGPRATSMFSNDFGGFDNPNGYQSRNPNAYRLKSWGYNAKKYGTFCGSNAQGIDGNVGTRPENCNEGFIDYIRANSDVNPILDGGFSRRYPGTNNHHIWLDISSGIKHFAAIDDYGGLFITPQSDNTFGQSEKGLGVTYSSLYKQYIDQGLFEDAEFFLCSGHNGVGHDFNYFPHIPRPGYVLPEEWTQTFYNNITFNQDRSSYKKYMCQCHYGITCGENPPGFGDQPCAQSLYANCDDVNPLNPRIKDLTCVLMGSLVSYAGGAFGDDGDDPFVTEEKDTQPKYTKVECGLYNTLCLTNENRLEIYGSYVRVNDNGDAVTGPSSPAISCFIPQALLSKAGEWSVQRACPVNCNGATHSPIISYSYTPPSSSEVITHIKSSGDYSLCITADNRLHVWGEASMVPGEFNPSTYLPGNIAYNSIQLENVLEIIAVAAGVNSIYVHYTRSLGTTINGEVIRASTTYEYTRYNLNGISTDVPESLNGRKIIDLDAGFLHAVAISSSRSLPKVWRARDFAEGTLKFQFKDFDSLPYYLRRQAFFHALPGGWDYSKWLYGGICCGGLDSPITNPVFKSDPCSALAYNIYNNNSFNIELSRSGNPQYYWMRQDWRRNTTQSLTDMRGQGIDKENEEACRPDSGLDLEGSSVNFSFMSSSVSTCLNRYGRVWSDARPSAVPAILRTVSPVVSPGANCYTLPCTEIQVFVNPRINTRFNFLSVGIDLPPRTGYRATKDVFQKMTFFAGSADRGTATDTVCPAPKTFVYSYFKYAERHSYLGYNSEKDTWEIYENPDFLKELSPAFNKKLLRRINEDDINSSPLWTQFYGNSGYDDYENCEDTPSEPQCSGCTLFGFGGGTLPPNPSGETGCRGYRPLKNYPMTGPNYGVEWIVETPVVVNDSVIQESFNYSLLPSSTNPNEFCDGCLSTGLGASTIIQRMGPGGFQFDGSRGPIDASLVSSDTMLYGHFYNETFRATESPKALLKGASTNFYNSTIPPNNSNTDVVGKPFSDVLFDREFTETFKPWRYSASKKWIPICWKTPLEVPVRQNSNVISSVPLYFNYGTILIEGNSKTLPIREIGITAAEPVIRKKIKYNFFDILPINLNDADYDNHLRKLETFITVPNYPNVEQLQAGSIQFFVWARQFWEKNNITLFFKIFKANVDGSLTYLGETLPDITVPPTSYRGGAVGDGSLEFGDVEDFRELVTSYYFDEPIDFNIQDRIYVEMWAKGGEGQTGGSYDPSFNDLVEILYEDNTYITIPNPDDLTNPLPTDIIKFTRMQYNHLEENSSNPCFSGFVASDNLQNNSQSFDPNIVKLIYDDQGNFVGIAGSPVSCNILGCCD